MRHRFEKIIKHVHRNYGDAITSNELAKLAGLSVSQFERRFGDAFGTSPKQYLLRVRIEAAARLLASTGQTVSEIAYACGFHDHAHLSRSFSKMMNMAPTRYRAANRLERHSK